MTVRPLDLKLVNVDEDVDGKSNQAFPNIDELSITMKNHKKSIFVVNEKGNDEISSIRSETSQNMKRKKKLKYRATVDDFTMSSTLHGLKHCYNAPSRPQRIVWVIFLCGAFGYFLYLCVSSFNIFLSYPIKTKVTIITEGSSTFPAVTFCNYNMFVKSKVRGTLYEDFLRKMHRRYDPSETKSNDSKVYNFTNTSHMYIALSHDLNEMLLSCTWQGSPCNASDFKRTFTSMGACYTFNSGANRNDLLQVHSSGKYYGLEIFLTAQQEEYVGIKEFETAGFKVLLHDQKEPPLVDNDGFAVAPGAHTLVSVLKRKVDSLRAPYESQCSDREIPHYKTYTRSACTLYCYTQYIHDTCGCFPIHATEHVNSSMLCTPVQYMDCVMPADLELKQSVESSECSCPEPCSSTVFEPSLSYGQFPSEENLHTIAKQISTSVVNITTEQAKEMVRKNAVLINIFYKELNFEYTVQSPAFTGSDLLSTIGGQLGLFAGASILTIHEFVDLLINLLAIKLGFR